MDLPTFIKTLGVDNAAALFEEKPRTVMAWMYRERFPRPSTGKKIVERTKGKVTYAGIYTPSEDRAA
jgi:hypothetical protein